MSSVSSEPDLAGQESAEHDLPWSAWIAPPFVIAVYGLTTLLIAPLFIELVARVYGWLRHWSVAQSNAWINSALVVQVLYGLLAYSIVLVALGLFLRHYHRSLADIGLKRFRGSDVLLGLMAVPVYYLFYILLLAIVTHFVPALNVNQQQDIGFSNVRGLVPLLLTFMSLVILPPLVEEILMRGYLFTSLRKKLNFGLAALITSLIFAAGHLPEGGSSGPLWVGALDTFTLSLVLCYLRQKSGSLWASITLHAIKNGIAFMALFILRVH
ncbi:MAG TPA: CPBP family intramembrane glutamic endopeptidase [Candidatus Dormibacteraeota bacterium]|nr:CPBP family intramembrane glutamic endopeptidase [Candidatus Dormibacteraeota bacterium]